MSQTLEEIAKQLRDANKKVQLIYAFNGTGKTRLSRALKDLVAPQTEDGPEGELSREKILYYNAFTEDLFYWNNDLEGDGNAKLVIQPNTFTEWILVDQGQEANITKNFQRYVNDKLTPKFNQEYTVQTKDELGQDKEIVIKAFSEVTFSVEAGGDEETGDFKISKGEESNFIWSIFFTLLEEVVSVLSIAEADDRPTDQFNGLQYVFVDDPVSSLDENHLIELAVNLAILIKAAIKVAPQLKFVITTHSPLFYNVLHNELDLKKKPANEGCYLLERLEDGTFNLNRKYGDSNQSFSYHLHLRRILEGAIAEDKVERYHFTLLRNLYEKTAGFLGYARWSDLLDTAPGNKDAYVRVINTFSHSALSNEQVRDPTPPEKNTVKLLLDNLINNYGFLRQDEQNG
jgi:hypothetical protein